MKKYFNIVELENLSGPMANICSVKYEDSEQCEFESLIEFNLKDYKLIVSEIIRRLDRVGNTTGVQSSFFEFKVAPDVYVLKDTENLRVFCIIKQNNIIILGGGGSKLTSAYQDDPNINEPFEEIQKISSKLDSTFTGFPTVETLESCKLYIEVDE